MERTLVLFLLLVGCGDPKFGRTWSSHEGTVRSAATVEAYLLDRPVLDPNKPLDWNFWKWKTVGDPVVVDAGTAKQLADVLLDEKSYSRGAPKACIPKPDVKVRFVKGADDVTVLFCFECRMLFVKGTIGFGEDNFDPAAPALVAIVKKLFPKSESIQALK